MSMTLGELLSVRRRVLTAIAASQRARLASAFWYFEVRLFTATPVKRVDFSSLDAAIERMGR